MGNPHTPGLPSVATKRTATFRKLLLSGPEHNQFLPRGEVIDGSQSRDPTNTGDLDVLQAGLLMGRITATGLYAPSILGVTTVAYDNSASVNTTLTVGLPTAVELNRRIGASGTFNLTGPPTAGGTVAVQTVTYSSVAVGTGVIAVSAIAADAIAGSFIQPTDGPETMVTLINDGSGIEVTDEDNADVDVPFATPVIAGLLDASQIINWPSNAVLRTYVRDQLRNNINVILNHVF